MKILPFGKNVLVQPHESDTILKSAEGSLSEYGTVIAVGSKVETLKVGDTIGFTIFGINALEVEGKKAYLVPETDEFILATIELA